MRYVRWKQSGRIIRPQGIDCRRILYKCSSTFYHSNLISYTITAYNTANCYCNVIGWCTMRLDVHTDNGDFFETQSGRSSISTELSVIIKISQEFAQYTLCDKDRVGAPRNSQEFLTTPGMGILGHFKNCQN